MAYSSKLEEIIGTAWESSCLPTAKQIVIDHISSSQIKSRDTIVRTVESIQTKRKLDFYLANSLLKFEKLSINSVA